MGEEKDNFLMHIVLFVLVVIAVFCVVNVFYKGECRYNGYESRLPSGTVSSYSYCAHVEGKLWNCCKNKITNNTDGTASFKKVCVGIYEKETYLTFINTTTKKECLEVEGYFKNGFN